MTYNTDDKRFKRYVYVKRRIAKAQGAAKTVGTLYLLATIILAALFYLGVSKISPSSSTVYKVSVAVNAVALIAMVICLIVAFTKLRWLFARKASRLYGFNRNMYAMDDLGKIFSFVFATGLAACFFTVLTNTDFKITSFGYIYLALGLIAHFVLGLIAGSVSVFDTIEGITEQKREVGYFAPLMRNLVQIIATAAMLVLLADGNAVLSSIAVLMEALQLILDGQMKTVLADVDVLIFCVGQIVLGMAVFFMIFSATSTKEFDMEGPETPGRKRFLLWSIFALVGAVALLAALLMADVTTGEVFTTIIAYTVIALVAVVVEICTIRCPHVNYEKLDDMDAKAFIRANANNNQPNVYMHYEVNNTTTPAPDNYTVYGLDD